MDAPILKIGGKDFTMLPVSFAAVQRAVPALDAMAGAGRAAQGELTGADLMDKLLATFGAFIGRDGAALAEEMSYIEVIALSQQWNAILTWVGLVPASGESPAAS